MPRLTLDTTDPNHLAFLARNPVRHNPRRRVIDNLLGTPAKLIVETYNMHRILPVSKFTLIADDGDTNPTGDREFSIPFAWTWDEWRTPESATFAHAICDMAGDLAAGRQRTPGVNYLLTQCLNWLFGESLEFWKVWGVVEVREAEPILEGITYVVG